MLICGRQIDNLYLSAVGNLNKSVSIKTAFTVICEFYRRD